MFSVSFMFVAVLGFVATSPAQEPVPTVQIESKIDGKVLTVTDEVVPPIGTYRRFAVAPRLRDDSLSQVWDFRNWTTSTQGLFYNRANKGLDEVSDGLICGNCFPYSIEYEAAEVTEDGYRLLTKLDFMADDIKCLQNTGIEGESVGLADCNLLDESQLWIFRDVE